MPKSGFPHSNRISAISLKRVPKYRKKNYENIIEFKNNVYNFRAPERGKEKD